MPIIPSKRDTDAMVAKAKAVIYKEMNEKIMGVIKEFTGGQDDEHISGKLDEWLKNTINVKINFF